MGYALSETPFILFNFDKGSFKSIGDGQKTTLIPLRQIGKVSGRL